MNNKAENLIKEIIMEKNEEQKKDMTATTGKGKGLRFNQGKLRFDLVEPHAFEDFVQVLTDGANKYFDRNWENGLSWTSVLASLKRHVAAIEKGEDYDPESGRLHIAHAACNVHFLNAFYYIFPQGDDRPKNYLKFPKIGLDIDGVLADFMGAWNNLHPEVSLFPTTWYTDRKIKDRFDDMRNKGTLDEFYLNIKPLINASELLYDPHCYITSRPVSKEITEQWLDKHHFPSKPVYSIEIRKSKVDAVKESGCEVFIEDSFDNFVDLSKHGITTFLLTQCWNIKHDVGHFRMKSINDLPFFK